MKPNELIDRLLSDERVRDIDYPTLDKALPDADYTLIGTKGRGRTWWHPAARDQFTVRDRGDGQPMYGDEIDKVAKHLKAVKRLMEERNGQPDAGAAAEAE
jgi:hypothetical protein